MDTPQASASSDGGQAASLRAEIDRVRADPEFVALVDEILADSKEILDRLADL